MAVNENGQAILVWRSVETSGNEANPLEVTQERLLYKVYTGSQWSTETYTLFNGSSGFVKGVDVELLADGTAAVAYALDTGSDGNIEDYEVCYALLDIDEASHEDDARTVHITTDRHLDEAPQLTTAKLDGDEHFVLGWHSYQNTSGVDTHDLRLAVFDAKGTPRTDIPGSLSDMVGSAAFNGQFTFAEGADTFEELSVIYTEASLAEDQGDILRSIQFSAYDGSYIPSAPLTVGKLENAGTAEWYDAYTSGNTVATIIQSDVPSGTASETIHRYKNGALVEEEIVIETSRTDLCTASASYSEAFSVDSVIVDYSSLRTNSYTPISFTITNQGTRPMTQVTVNVGGQTQSVGLDNLLPGKSQTVSVVYLTGSEITNPAYTISSADSSSSGAVYLDYPDVGISGLSIIKEYDGVRSFNVNLYDQAAAALYQSDRRVMVGVYEDPGCTTLMNGTYFGGSASVVVSSADIMNAIDAGYYPAAMTFDAKAFVQAQGYDELPAGGIPMYVKVSVEELRNGKWVTLPEANSADNLYTFTAESLLSRNGGEQITEQTSMDNTSGITNATVTVSNNSISKTGAGVVTAVLMDGNGNVLETKQSNTSLDIEDVQAFAFAFSQAGARVIANYAETTNDGSNAELASISLGNTVLSISGETMTLPVASGTHTLILTPANPASTISVNDQITSNGIVNVTVGNVQQIVSVKVTSADSTAEKNYTLVLEPVSNFGNDPVLAHTIFFDANGGTVTPASAQTNAEGKLTSPPVPTHSGSYSFRGWYTAPSGGTKVTVSTVFNANTTIYAQWTYTGSGGGDVVASYAITIEDAKNGNVTVSPIAAPNGATVTITVDPDNGYTLETLTVTDKNGKNIELTKVSSTQYTFKMPASQVTVKATFMDDNTMLNFFVDVPSGAYYYDAVLWAVQEGITNGTSATTFSPDASCTRAQMATFLWRAAGSPEPVGNSNPFADVPADAYYAKAVQWAVEQGITNGTSATTFSPDVACTRAQMATFLWRNAGSPATVNVSDPFTDVPADAYYTKAIQWAYEQKVTGGTSATTFSPNDPCTRAQMVTFLYRYFVK